MQRYIRSPLALTLSISLLANFLTACNNAQTPDKNASSPTTTAPGDEGLKLGALLPITGDLAAIGQNMPEAAALAVETINACGGVNGKPVTLVKEDDQTDPAAGASAMTKLAEVDKVAG
ncbi:MAG: ABC transporter substrate-binding protein, partial [Microcystis panniformis]